MRPARARYALHAFDYGHLVELTDLWIDAWNKAMPSIDFETRRVWFADRLQALLDAGTALTCVFDTANGDMAGFVTLDEKTGRIDQIAVAPGHWSKGAAAMLIADAKARAPGRLVLEVNQDNARAVRFYEKQDFRRAASGVNQTSGLTTWRYEWTRQ